MPLPFAELCTLLARLEAIELHDPPLLADEKYARISATTNSWFKSHRRALDALGADGVAAVLSSLLPESRTDRVYGLQSTGLSHVLCRCLGLSVSRSRELQNFASPGCGDLAICLERVLQAGGSRAIPRVTVEEVDAELCGLASQCRFSDPAIARERPRSASDRHVGLSNILRRVTPMEGKWLVRIILKDLNPVRVDEQLVLRSVHFLLPDLLRFQRNFHSALTLLQTELREYPEDPDNRSRRLLRQGATQHLRPAVGTKVGRPTFVKARGIDHCLTMLDSQRWVMERKYDGEYCEFHIDMTREDRIKIFSKSGKDSTLDRQGVHQTLIDCLRLDKPDCKIHKQAILLGELVVYSDDQDQILPFEEIRKHVSRSGASIGTLRDSRPGPGEHLALVFYDLLLLDDEVIMHRPVTERRSRLRTLYRKIHGRAMSAEWKVLDKMDPAQTKRMLITQFAASIARRCEGLILKPYDAPYFPLEEFNNRLIKVKKDYIAGMGDEADFLVFGASFDPQRAISVDAEATKWTAFHLGCLVNAEDVRRFNARPVIKHVSTISSEACIPAPVLHAANSIGNFSASPFDASGRTLPFEVRSSLSAKIHMVFHQPLVFEVLGSGFEKPSNQDFLMLRHPRVTKMHEDRSFKDCISFQELQAQAMAARESPIDSESQETRRWVERLEKSCRRKFKRDKGISPKSKCSPTRKRRRLESGSGSPTTYNSLPNPLSFSMSPEGENTASGEIITASPDSAPPRNTPLRSPKRHKANDKIAEISTSVLRLNASPLLDITNRASPRRSSDLTTRASRIKPVITAAHKVIANLLPHLNPRGSPLPPLCYNAECLFNNTSIYLAPCIASMPYITDDLLAHQHGTSTTYTLTLAHWDRDTHPSMSDPSMSNPAPVIPESQAYPFFRKLVLVESRRRAAVDEVVRALVSLSAGRSHETIQVFDWRVLESCHSAGVSAAGARPWFVGEMNWCPRLGRPQFMWGRGVGG